MVRTKQGGSILSFAVIGVVLVSLLAGGVWAVRNVDFGAKSSSDESKVAQTSTGDKKTENGDKNKSETKPKADKAESDEKRDRTTVPSEDDRTASGSVAVPEAKPEQERQRQTDTAVADANKDKAPVAELPQTGSGNLTDSVSVALFIGALVAYAASRRYAAGL